MSLAVYPPGPEGWTDNVLPDVVRERHAQHDKWGEQNHDLPTYFTILAEEVGELAEAILADKFGAAMHSTHSDNVRAEAIQVAAVAVAIVEMIDRKATR